MIHCFELHGDHLAYDPNSQALLQVDPESAAIIRYLDRMQSDLPEPIDGEALAERIDSMDFSALSDSEGWEEEHFSELWEALRPAVVEGAWMGIEKMPDLNQLYPEEPRIKAMCLHLCHDCNLRCRYCFAGMGDYQTGKRTMLSEKTGKRAIDFLIEASGPRRYLDIDFFGGEPLLNWPVVVALANYAKQRGTETGKDLRLTLTTNAWLLDEEKIDFINAYFKNVVLSFDGRPEIQDAMRPTAGGQGTYERTLRNIKRFVAERGDREYYLRGTYTHENLDFYQDVLHLAKEGIEQLSLEPMVGDSDDPLTLKLEDLPEIRESYAKLARSYVDAWKGQESQNEEGTGRTNVKTEKTPPFHFFHFNIQLEGGPCIYKRYKGCGSGLEYIAVTPDGEVYPCHQFVGEDQFRMGTVYDQFEALNADIKKGFEPLLLPNLSACKQCWARFHCGGGCAANNWHMTGDLSQADAIYCELQRMRLEAALWIKMQTNQEV